MSDHDATAHSPSMLSSMLNGTPPASRPPMPGTVRRHSLDDTRLPNALTKGNANNPQKAPAFSSAEKALIHRVHGYMSHTQLLAVLNERVICDLGDRAMLHTAEQLKAEIDSVISPVPATGNDWGSLRKLLVKARRQGVLQQIDDNTINDFAVVFSLNNKQVMLLKDVLFSGEEA